MTTISVDWIKGTGPSPLKLKSWTEDWQQLNNLSKWNKQGNQQTCTTDSTADETRSRAEKDLKNWVNEDPGHRSYTIN